MLAMPAAAPAPAMEMEMAADSAMPGAPAQPGTPIAVRTDFNPLALFAPAERTAPTAPCTWITNCPTTLARYRLMVCGGYRQHKFGSAENNITARLPLMVRPSAPLPQLRRPLRTAVVVQTRPMPR